MQTTKCPEVEKCLELIHLVLDSEASSEQENYLTEHLEMCIQCLENYNIEKEIRTALRNRLENKKVPIDLISIIKDKISEIG